MSKYNLAFDLKTQEEKKKVFNFTEESLEAHDRNVINEAMPDIICVINAMCTLSMLRTLHDLKELRFGTKRLKRFYAKYHNTFENLADGTISYKDLNEMLKDECKINIVITRVDGTEISADYVYNVMRGSQKCSKIHIR